MGRATRWLKDLPWMKKREKDQTEKISKPVVISDKPEKKRWSFLKSGKDSVPVTTKEATARPATVSVSDINAWRDQNKHAIAVAAATSAVADAAVAAAHAAVAVVRLTSQGRGPTLFCDDWGQKWAAIKIQTFFRGYLARKALRALKGLVKLQAVVRGFLVRKRTAATLRSMQALIRVQNVVRAQRAQRSFNNENRFPQVRHRKSLEHYDETRSELFHSKRMSASYENHGFMSFKGSPKIVEIDTFKPKSRSRRLGLTLSEFREDMLPYQTMMSSPLLSSKWCFMGDECKFPTAQSTPRFGSKGPTTPSRIVCGDGFPSYMANTTSFSAKLRSHSAPKQRPELGGFKKRVSLNEIMAARNSTSSVRMRKSCVDEHEQVFGL